MEYKELRKIYYSDSSRYESEYLYRYHSPYAHHIDFMIGDASAFFVLTPEMVDLMLAIQRTDKHVSQICHSLPAKAIDQFSLRCLIDEIVLTNSIEGVNSTRKEVDSALSSNDRKTRFKGLVQKYVLLQTRDDLPLSTCEDIRRIYDDLVLDEIIEDNPANRPDGSVFRNGPVSVLSATQKELHRGLFPEPVIIDAMERALQYLNDDTEEVLLRIAVFHYLLGYIHPFYDGNGRLNRFISSYMLSRELEPLLGYRLSYTIRENIEKYYQAFKICNHPLNRGDLTLFVLMFLEVTEQSIRLLDSALQKRLDRLEHYCKQISILPEANDSLYFKLYGYLIQAQLFSDHGISTLELLQYLNVSRGTLRKKLAVIEQAGLLKIEKDKKEKYYMIDAASFDRMITDSNTLLP